MSLDLKQAEERPLHSVDELVEFFREAERPVVSEHLVGLEHEKLVYPVGSATAVPYEGDRGIRALLESLTRKGYAEFREQPHLPVIALTRGSATISLEPGGQLELSGSAVKTARAAHAENLGHLAELKEVTGPLGLRLVALGYRPFDLRDQMPWMPKTRYQLMRETLGARGSHALNMMLMTATGQASFDWADEGDCANKVSTAARFGPVLVALFANSPLVEGKPSGLMSFRSRVWRDVDNARCGYLPSMIDGSFSYRSYVDWALEAPLLFLRRDGKYLRPKMTFGELLARGYDGKPALHSDWVDHLSTLFPEIRIKKVLEVRGADCVSAPLTGALAALLRGLLYDPTALAEAAALIPKLSFEGHLAFHETAGREGLEGKLGKVSIAQLGRELVEIARRGLKRLDPDDAPLLDPLAEVAASGRSPARRVLEVFEKTRDPVKVMDAFEL